MKFFKQIVTAAFMISVSASMLNILQAAENKAVMRINDPIMEVNGEKNEIDPGIGTTPIISDGHTLVPIRAMIESFGGNVEWNAQTRTTTLTHGKNNIKLVIGSKNAYINGEEMTLDTVPVVVKGRTMLPLRFVSEGFGFDVEWDNDTKTITVTQNDINTADTEKVTAENTEPDADKNVEQEKNTAPNNNILVVYFTRADNIKISDDIDAVSSASLNKTDGKLKGNTQIAAEYIHEKVGGDIINIEAEEYYPSDYNEHTSYASDEVDKNARPAIKTHIDMGKYDKVYICYPIWWGTMPMPVYTFIESHDFDGKTVIPVSTSGGSGMGSTQKDIENMMPNAEVLKGFTVTGSSVSGSKDSISKAIDELSEQK